VSLSTRVRKFEPAVTPIRPAPARRYHTVSHPGQNLLPMILSSVYREAASPHGGALWRGKTNDPTKWRDFSH